MQRKWHALLVEEMRDSCGTEGASRMGDENVMAEAMAVQQALRFPGDWGFQFSRQRMEVVRLTALHTDRLYSSGNIPGNHFC